MWRKLLDTLKAIRISERSALDSGLWRRFEIGSFNADIHQRRYGSIARHHDRRPDEPFPSAHNNLLLFPIFDPYNPDKGR